MPERGDTAYSPRLREEEHSAAADELRAAPQRRLTPHRRGRGDYDIIPPCMNFYRRERIVWSSTDAF